MGGRANPTYLRFEELPTPAGRKTLILDVRSDSNGALLGQIRWYAAWRQYTFWPESATIFNDGCLEEIRDRIRLMMRKRKAT